MDHMYETGGMRRLHLRGQANIRKRLLIHACGFNLGVLMRSITGTGTPRTLQGQSQQRVAGLMLVLHLRLRPPVVAFCMRLGTYWGSNGEIGGNSSRNRCKPLEHDSVPSTDSVDERTTKTTGC